MAAPTIATASRRLLTLRRARLSTPHCLPGAAAAPLVRRHYSSQSSGFQPGPSPPRLPAEQQAEFERLQRAVAERFVTADAASTSTPTSTSATSPSPASTSRHVSSPTATAATTDSISSVNGSTAAAAAAEVDEEQLSAGVWRGAKPEFEGDVNPKTGEVGGPKNEPLRWGSAGDWSYNGRVTDF